MVNDNGEAPGTTSVGPAESVGEAGIGISQEKLASKHREQWGKENISEGRGLTISSFLTLLAFPHALMTKGSLEAITATTCTPFSFS